MSKETVKRLIALMIGIGTISAGLMTWRAGQIGSTAAYEDRQSIGEQVDQENVRIDVAVEASRQARQYDRYLAEYELAAELDADAEMLGSTGRPEAADAARSEATALRTAATDRAEAAGVFGIAVLEAEPGEVGVEPLPFDLATRIDSLLAEESTGLDSSSDLHPQQWADEADGIRERIRNLTYWVALLLLAVVLLTGAEVTVSRGLRRSGLALGTVLIAVTWVGVLATGFRG